jgi:hypothetical protein
MQDQDFNENPLVKTRATILACFETGTVMVPFGAQISQTTKPVAIMLHALGNHGSGIEEGGVYRRTGTGISSMTETAEVLEVARDKLGIPHVRFYLRVACGGTGSALEQRTLALDTFYARYKERVNIAR